MHKYHQGLLVAVAVCSAITGLDASEAQKKSFFNTSTRQVMKNVAEFYAGTSFGLFATGVALKKISGMPSSGKELFPIRIPFKIPGYPRFWSGDRDMRFFFAREIGANRFALVNAVVQNLIEPVAHNCVDVADTALPLQNVARKVVGTMIATSKVMSMPLRSLVLTPAVILPTIWRNAILRNKMFMVPALVGFGLPVAYHKLTQQDQ